MNHTSTDQPENARSSRVRLLRFVVLALSLAGIGVSIHLTQIHYHTHTDPAFHPVCAVSEQVNCETVARSPFSVFLGIPVSVLAIFGYIVMAVLSVWGLLTRRLHPLWPTGALLGLFSLSLAASAVLAYISFTRIDSLCIYCMASYAINVVLFVLGVTMVVKSGAGPIAALISDMRALLSRPLVLACLVIMAGGALLAARLLIPPYWQHIGWRELPELPNGVDEKGHHWIGARNPVVTIVEFSDYECPYCRRAHKEMRLMIAEHRDTVRLVHRHLPLDSACNETIKGSFHERACEFSRAAECAAEQEMFWPMNDALFSIQETVSTERVDTDQMAVELGLDRSTFKACMEKTELPARIRKDMEDSRRLKVEGTPTFFIGPQPFQGGIPEAVLEAAIRRAREGK